MQTMQDFPLRVSQIIDHAAQYHPERKIISRSVEGPITETTWRHIHKQAKKLSQALISLGVKKGVVFNIDKTINSIRAAIEDTEQNCKEGNLKLSHVVVGIAGQYSRSMHTSDSYS